jgi:hypothetical protein
LIFADALNNPIETNWFQRSAPEPAQRAARQLTRSDELRFRPPASAVRIECVGQENAGTQKG